MTDRYLRALGAELGAVGIRGSRRRRILAEAADHLRESGDPELFGEPKLIAARFADELATSGARRVAFVSFLALAPAGVALALLLGLNRPGPDITSAKTLPLGIVSAFVIVLAPQISLAAGLLTVARAWRLRAETVAPAGAIRLLHRRAAVALGAGAATLAGVAIYAVEYSRGLPVWWTILAFAAAGTAIVPVAAAAVALGRTAHVRTQTEGAAGDLFDDLAPLVKRLRSICAAGPGASACFSRRQWPRPRSSAAVSTKARETRSPSSWRSAAVLPRSDVSWACVSRGTAELATARAAARRKQRAGGRRRRSPTALRRQG